MPTINKRGIDTIMSLKKKIAAAFIACAMTLAVVPSAFACTALYVGSDLTEDGTTMFGRIEDLGTNDYNKLFNISPAGKHTAGEVYEGCYGFTYTFTHDSYRYPAGTTTVWVSARTATAPTSTPPMRRLAPTRRASWSLPPSLSTAPTPC